MTEEKDFIKKRYYEQLIVSHPHSNDSVKVLADAFLKEQKSEIAELSAIRYAQGEVYFHHKDYETAIFKWEKVDGELELWSKKNIADAYYELGLLANAKKRLSLNPNRQPHLEDRSIPPAFFSIYIEEGKPDEAVKIIKSVVASNPDYPNVTNLARSLFEEYKDYGSAIELAVDEAIRTRSLTWYDILNGYADQGLTTPLEPAYYTEALISLYEIDKATFERLAASFWESYKELPFHFSWLIEFDRIVKP